MKALLLYAVKVLNDRGHYTTFSKPEHNPTRYLAKHPVTGGDFEGMGGYWLGTFGASVSGEFMARLILEKLADGMELTGAIFWHFPGVYQGQHDIICEVAMAYAGETETGDRLYCSGMTDYSGEGARAYNALLKFLTDLMQVYQETRPVVSVNVTDVQFADVAAMINNTPVEV